jgi:formyltetrahydrofolate deformylase
MPRSVPESHAPLRLLRKGTDNVEDLDLGRLLVDCPDRPGISAAVTGYLFAHGANITDFQQFSTDPSGGQFFLRVEFIVTGLAGRLSEIEAGFADLARTFDMQWRFALAARRKRLAILVSKADHALQELLSRHQAGDLAADIEFVVSNHRDVEAMVSSYGIAFEHIPVTPTTKPAAEDALIAKLSGRVDTIVLARYMQVLTPRVLAAFPNQVINIHHSFLPAFIGADPYAQAADRGVKLIGATAHYVTEELDAGPIIEQDVARVDHRQSVADLRRAGRYVERAVLARAVSWHVEDRVIRHGNKTIVFA